MTDYTKHVSFIVDEKCDDRIKNYQKKCEKVIRERSNLTFATIERDCNENIFCRSFKDEFNSRYQPRWAKQRQAAGFIGHVFEVALKEFLEAHEERIDFKELFQRNFQERSQERREMITKELFQDMIGVPAGGKGKVPLSINLDDPGIPSLIQACKDGSWTEEEREIVLTEIVDSEKERCLKIVDEILSLPEFSSAKVLLLQSVAEA